ncbi:lysine--tRNA ligase [Desulforudis sp. 1088]|uniref:lysine--tRNA ligase n=1 Tax=unclassified Candidatus Desulforudis TaxID=2635950 RepID=UPI00348CE763
MDRVHEQQLDLSELERVRRDKLAELRQEGIKPYGGRFERTHLAREVVDNFETLDGRTVSLAGRLTARRGHGKATFADLRDGSGRVQIYVRLDVVGDEAYELFKKLDIGDIIGLEGSVFKTRMGEVSVNVSGFTLLSKSLRPLPEKWHGLKDVELRYRQRYLDLIVNPETKDTFVTRSRVLQLMRRFLDERGFLEVETPMMQPLAGGAAARPFKTYHNALDMPLYLRIAPELYLKRLLVGGMEKVYEINRNFRNEGISTRHNPEFTMLELYEAYSDYIGMMELTEELITYVVEEATGTLVLPYGDMEIDYRRPWTRMTMLEAVGKHAGIDFSRLSGQEAVNIVKAKLKDANITVEALPGTWGEALNTAFEEFVEDKLVQPTFIYDYPIEISPLAKKKDDDPRLTYRFELIIAGRELANAFSELNDPVDQKERFMSQLAKRQRGDEEAHAYDEDYVIALEHGMPPAGGLGIGIDRLVMLITNKQSIRDVILFPLLRPREMGSER